jgi:hypothetical protein
MKIGELWGFRDQAVARVDLTGFELYARDRQRAPRAPG